MLPHEAAHSGTAKTRSLLTYALFVGLSVAALMVVLRVGAGVEPRPGTANAEPDGLGAFRMALQAPLSLLLIQVLTIIVAARGIGALFARVGQPSVIGEMFAGIALGPSVLGAVAPAVTGFVFPAHSLGSLSLLSQVGILLFMFVVGMDLDLRVLEKTARTAVVVSHVSIIFPFILGTASALWLYPAYSGEHTGFSAFALFMGISMSITAFPVLARILQERGLSRSNLGATAITCAAVDDITAWCLLAIIVALARAQGLWRSAMTMLWSAIFIAAVMLLVRPALRRMVARLAEPASPGRGATTVVLATLFGCALCSEAIGIHALFGAFLAGVAMPESPGFRRFLSERIEYLSSVCLLPIFFALTGLRTQIGLLSGAADWVLCLALLAIAVVGKFGGGMIAARLSGLDWRQSAALGALMNTRGLMELVALNLGLELGVLSPKVFSMLVLMALVTTFATGPVLKWLGVGEQPMGAPDGREHPAPSHP